MHSKLPSIQGTLVLNEQLHAQLLAVAAEPLETAGVLLVRHCSDSAGNVRLLAVEYVPVPTECYMRREVDSLGIASEGYVPALSKAEETGTVAIWLHSHPGDGSIPLPSTHDDIVDRQIADLFRIRANSEYYAALIISPIGSGLNFSGFLETESGQRIPINHVQIVGDRLTSYFGFQSSHDIDLTVFDRSVRALGGPVQLTLSKLRVGVVGCGGTGSAVVEQLARLGVRTFILSDPDTLSESNVTRVYGSQPTDIGMRKVELACENIHRIAPEADCCPKTLPITTEKVARDFSVCDVIFGCTDDNAGRLVLSRLSTFFMIPVFDLGVLISSNASGELTGIDGRVTTLVPGSACLMCRDRIDINRARAEQLIESERSARIKEGYAPELGGVEPAVVPYTTMVASVAVSELLERMLGFGPEPRPSEVLIRYHDREFSTNLATPRERHYCHPSRNRIGRGVTEPFLEMTWTS